MNVTIIASFDNHASVDSSWSAASYPLLANDESVERAVSLDTCREGEDTVHLNDWDRESGPPPVELSALRSDSIAATNSPSLDRESSSSQVMQNDIVILAGERGTWQVVALVKGSRADIRRREGFDTRVVTAVLQNLTVVRCAGSPESNY
jgi:hypothetical protein